MGINLLKAKKDFWQKGRGLIFYQGERLFLSLKRGSKKKKKERKFGREEFNKGGHSWIIRRTKREGVDDGFWFEEGGCRER